MTLRTRNWSVAVVILILVVAAANAEAQPLHSIGVGIRAGLNDPPAITLIAKIQVARFPQVALSIRPMVLFEETPGFRVALSMDLLPDRPAVVHAGGGIAMNRDQSWRMYAHFTAGVEMAPISWLILGATLNNIVGDVGTDTEFIGSFNLALPGSATSDL